MIDFLTNFSNANHVGSAVGVDKSRLGNTAVAAYSTLATTITLTLPRRYSRSFYTAVYELVGSAGLFSGGCTLFDFNAVSSEASFYPARFMWSVTALNAR